MNVCDVRVKVKAKWETVIVKIVTLSFRLHVEVRIEQLIKEVLHPLDFLDSDH